MRTPKEGTPDFRKLPYELMGITCVLGVKLVHISLKSGCYQTVLCIVYFSASCCSMYQSNMRSGEKARAVAKPSTSKPGP